MNDLIDYVPVSTVESTVDLRFVIMVIIVDTVAMNYIVWTKILDIDILGYVKRFVYWALGSVGKKIAVKENRYHRDLEVGKINSKTKKVAIYRFFNDLIIDLGLKKKGCTPYEFMLFVILSAFLIAVFICEFIFQNRILLILLAPLVFAAELCFFYTRANVAHDKRIDAVIESENVICNDIRSGVVVGVRNSLALMPEIVRGDFKVFLDNVENKNYHIKTALLELNNNLGSIADDFIKQCIVFELEEEHGISGMFQDIVAVNNIKTELRNNAKRKYEETMQQFIIGAGAVIVFLGGAIAVYPELTEFYLHNTWGQFLICLDAFILLMEYVFITKMKAKKVG